MSGIDEIKAERQRQMEVEGWSCEHDDKHTDKSLALAAALYATPIQLHQLLIEQPRHGNWRSEIAQGEKLQVRTVDPWPWRDSGVNGSWNCWDKREKHDYRRRLIIAGALLAAEIDRLDRALTTP